MGDETEGFLNIVCEAPTVSAKAGVQKQRKRNKFEKRRERSRKAKRQQQQPPQQETSGSVAVAEKQQHPQSEKTEAPTVDTKPENDSSVQEEVKPAAVTAQAEPAAATPAPLLPLAPPSRKRRHVTEGDEEGRAKYMAEFHARPLEMDRRSGAKSTIAPSKDSQHLFDDSKLPLHPRLLRHVDANFTMKQATSIQSTTWQQFFQHKDKNLFIQSETGSGKTLAYLLPIVQSLVVDSSTSASSSDEDPPPLIRRSRSEGGTKCLILCPTRELASQTATVVETLCRATWLVGGCLSGGEKRSSEKARLRKGISVLVATPGRLLDHLCHTESLLMSLKGKLEYLVLDESDRLLDFGDSIQQIVQRIRANQPGSGRAGVTWRSLLVSATITSKEEALASVLLGSEDWVWAKPNSEGKNNSNLLMRSTPRQLSQLHMTVTAKLRLPTLLAFLVQRVKKRERTVVFMSTCDGVDYHEALLTSMDRILPPKSGVNDDDAPQSGIFGEACPVYKLHGNVPHTERQSILKNFNKSPMAILLATDVAARGLNLTDVDWTVQYDPPVEVADYAHRVGRAARAGRAGHSLLFLLPSERQFLEVLELKGVQNMDGLSVATTLNRAADICALQATAAGFRNKGEEFSAEVQRRCEEAVIQEDAHVKADYKPPPRKKGQPRPPPPCGRLLELGRKAYFSYIRAYPTKEKAVRHIFSSRALHVGHIARSFALRELPKSSMVAHAPKEQGQENPKKRQRLAFETKSLVEEVQEAVATKRQNKSAALANKATRKKISLIKADGTVDSTKARMMLMENATKLQQGGMNSF